MSGRLRCCDVGVDIIEGIGIGSLHHEMRNTLTAKQGILLSLLTGVKVSYELSHKCVLSTQ